MSILLFITAVVLSGIAAYYSVIGLIAIFSAAAIPVAIMGGSLEAAKLVVASWLYRYWKVIPILMRTYFTGALIVLMLITSMGIFGFLSKAHNDQSLVSGDVLSKISIYDEKIKTAKENIDANRKALKQLDEAVDQVMARSTTEQGADKAVQIRRSQAKERARLLQEIDAEQKKITKLNEERAPIAAEVRKVEAEVGPIKYIASLIYGDNPDTNLLERAVRWLIILLIIVFDPLAVLMLIAANLTQMHVIASRKPEESIEPIKQEEQPIDDNIQNKTLPDQEVLPVAVETAVPAETQATDGKDVVASVEPQPTVETVGVTEPPAVVPEVTVEEVKKPGPKKKTKKSVKVEPTEPVIEPVIDPVPQPALEQIEQDKSLSEVVPVKADLDSEVQKLIDDNDNESLENVYKKIVKELAKKNRSKSTHWGPLRTK